MTNLKISNQNLETIVTQLFNGDIKNVSIDISEISAIEFGKEIIKQKKEIGYNGKIKIPMESDIEQIEIILKKINEARLILTGAEFEIILSTIEPDADIMVGGGSEWMPKILPNGSILIRNHHRVIALSESIAGVLDISNKKLYNDLKLIHKYAKENLDVEDITSFNFLHRFKNGVAWTNKIPSKLSDFGQTIVFISQNFIELVKQSKLISLNNIIFNPLILNVANESRSGHCVLRVFKNKTFLYSTYRAADEYDTILENFSYYLGDFPDEDIYVKSFSTKTEFVRNYIQSTLKENSDFEIFHTKTLIKNHTLKLLIEDKFYNEFSNKKTWQVTSFVPFFAKDWDKPTIYYEENIPFWNISQKYDGKIIIVESNFECFKSIKNGKSELNKKIHNILKFVKPNILKIHLPLAKETSYLNEIDEKDVFDYGTKDCDTRITDFFHLIQNQYQKDIEKNQNLSVIDFFEYYANEFNFSLLFVLNNEPEPMEFHKIGLKISKSFSRITVIIPSYGFSQGYCDGEVDTGNSYQFIIDDRNIL